jgi:hypothetical protein
MYIRNNNANMCNFLKVNINNESIILLKLSYIILKYFIHIQIFMPILEYD